MPDAPTTSKWPETSPADTEHGRTLTRSDLVIIVGSVVAMALAAGVFYAKLNEVLSFVCSGVAIALLAALVGRCVDRLGDRLGAGATGVLQSALGNLPELFIAFFALRAGLLTVVQSAIIGSILANLLLVLGLAFLVGGLRHGTQRFDHGRARTTGVLLTLATAAFVLPSLAAQLHSPAGRHETPLSVAVAIVLLVIFALSVPASLRREPAGTERADRNGPANASAPAASGPGVEGHWPLWLAIVLLAAAGVAAGLVSDWFVDALQPAIDALHISPAFAGLVIVAIAGNAVENVIGIRLAARNEADYAISVIVNSPIQIALVLAPVLVLLSFLTSTTLTLVFAPLLVVSVVVAVIITTFIIFDGESNWLEGSILIAVYAIIATMFWWG
jgi:Ca2+:H+ antiporter